MTPAQVYYISGSHISRDSAASGAPSSAAAGQQGTAADLMQLASMRF